MSNQKMNPVERIEHAVKTGEYQMYAGMAGAALAGAILAPNGAARDEAMQEAMQYHRKMVEVVNRG